MFDWGSIFSNIVVFVLGAASGAASAVLTKLADRLAKRRIERIVDRFDVPRETFKIPISAKYNDLAARAEFRFMLVRYADDSLYNRLEGEQRKEAELQTRLFPVELQEAPGSDQAMLVFRLPIHPTLGTQFKLYAIPKSRDEIAPLTETLRTVHEIDFTGPSKTGEVWFLLKDDSFPRIRTVDTDPPGIKNNYVRQNLRA